MDEWKENKFSRRDKPTMGEIFLVICFIGYFLYDQFEYKRVTRFRFLFLPIFAIFQTINHFSWNFTNILCLAVISFGAWLIGKYQAEGATVHNVRVPKYYYQLETTKEEQSIYQKEIHCKGGKQYLIGWTVIFGIQLGMEVFRGVFSSHEVWHEFLGEVLRDLFVVYRIFDHESQWYVWALYGISNSVYLIYLCYNYPNLRRVITQKDKLD